MSRAALYDLVPYVNRPIPLTHPNHLGVLGRLHGLQPAPINRARVLELGASDGGNLTAMAAAYLDGEFIGVDVAARAIERGRRRVAALGFGNVHLYAMDLIDIDSTFGRFDYVIAHGLYGWTPREVGDRILAIARTHLAPHGIAFVSYNTYPGRHVSLVLREAMLLAAPVTMPLTERLARARAILEGLVRPRPEAKSIDSAIAEEAADILAVGDNAMLHDYLAEPYEPVYFQEFVAHAGRHGLQYLDDASVIDTWNPRLAPEAVTGARDLSGDGRIAHEQYLDMLRLRRFRQSLLCRADVAIDEKWQAGRAVGLFAASRAREIEPGHFASALGLHLTTEHPDVCQLLRRLIASWPADELVRESSAELVLELYRRGLIELRLARGRAGPAGDRPCASPLARGQVQLGDPEVSSLTHLSLALGDDDVRRFLLLVDGSRDRETLARDAGVNREAVNDYLDALAGYGLILAER